MNTKINNPLLTEAFRLMVAGFSVIPLRKDKTPYLGKGEVVAFREKSADENQILSWWEKWPNANVGIVTGKLSGITVIDVDTYKGAKADPFPETYTVKTGNGGLQLYYKYEPGFTISASGYKEFPGVDLRSDGGYVVAPPSVTDYFDKAGKKVGGAYSILKNISFAPFPTHLFPNKKPKKSITQTLGVGAGSRNDSITSFIGSILHSAPEKEWSKEAWEAVQIANQTYKPPLPLHELRATFESIVRKETERRKTLTESPIQLEDGETLNIKLAKNANGTAYRDMANVIAVLRQHPYYTRALRFNSFRQEIEYNGKPLEEADLIKIQYFMQTMAGLRSIPREAVFAGISHYASEFAYDEAQEWLQSLTWDGVPRLDTWLIQSTKVEDTPYHRGIGAQWFMGLIRRIVHPGSVFDYVLVFVGPQGIGKTSLFRIIGGPWYKSYTGAMDNKDFYLALRGALVVDLDEGAALYRSEAIKIKSIITQTHDEFRAPYDRVMKKYPRRFVFSMSTNDTEPFHDVTGNRRYWTVDGEATVDFKWLEENRDQIFAEAYHYHKNKIPVPEVPMADALEQQELHLADDPWTDLIVKHVRTAIPYCKGSPEYSTTAVEVFVMALKEENLSRLGRAQEMRIATIFKKELGLVRCRILKDDKRQWRWVISAKKRKELQEKNAEQTPDGFGPFGNDEPIQETL